MNEGEWEADWYDKLPEERKQELMKQANEIFNSDKSPLSFMVQSSHVSISVIKRKHWYSNKKVKIDLISGEETEL